MPARNSHLLPLPVHRAQRTGLVGAGSTGTGSAPRGRNPDRRWAQIRGLLLSSSIYGCIFPVVGGILWLDGLKGRLRVRRLAQLASDLGLSFHHRVRTDQLEPFTDLPLFFLTRQTRTSAADLWQGYFEDRRVLLFEYAYSGYSPDRTFRFGASQTVLIVPDAGNLPDFYAGPDEWDWDEILPQLDS